jgi:L-asparagine transporter-like permease
MFTWMMIFATHFFFRRHHDRRGGLDLPFKMKFFPATTLLGGGLMLAVLVTTAFTEIFRMTLVFGVPFLALLALSFRYIRSRQAPLPAPPRAAAGVDGPGPTC